MSKTLFYNAKVYVERDTFAEAVYQEDGWIKAVGSNADVCALAADDAEKIDCEGRVLVPGFNDSHMHMCFTGENMLVPDLSKVHNKDELVAVIKKYVDDNPGITILPVDYVNDPAVICRNDNMISINAALEVDLWGQVCAESVGTKHMSGTGGQVDYVRGACQSRGGKSFIAFSSTAKNDTISKIKSVLTPGAVVTTSKNDVDYVVTEYGVAHLRGEPLSSRARQLIAIAHPNFRDELTFEAKKRGILI